MAEVMSNQIKIMARSLTVVIVISIIAIVVTEEYAGVWYLKWAAHHPAFTAKYDPHHWLKWLAVLAVVWAVYRGLAHVLREPLALFRDWRRVFLPFFWERPTQKMTGKV